MIGQDDYGRDGDDATDGDISAIDNAYETDELELAEDENLPWLESADYEDDDPGNDTARVIGFALIGLLAIGLVLGGIWYFSNRGPDRELMADGSTIVAPEGPYKEKPENPGGKTFEGTGNVAPGVGEGKTAEGRLAQDDTAPKPSIDTAQSDDSGSDSAQSGGIGVQVGAFSTEGSAKTGWETLSRQTSALQGVKYRVVKGQADIGTVYRLQAIAGDAASARSLCNTLKGEGIACQVKQ